MYEIVKSVISAGGYKLADIQHKVKKLFVMGDLTEEQADELLAMASGGVSVDAERPETLKLIQTLADEIEALKERVTALEGGKDEEETTYPVWTAWDGISKDYQHGAIVSHNGELWQSVFNGQNVWEPGAVGTESLWVKYTA
jgi:hypothetical protein